MGRLILGVDPGKTGALAFLDADTGGIVFLEDMPDHSGSALGTQVAMLLDDVSPSMVASAWVESQTIRPRQAGMTDFITNYGAILGALGFARVPTTLVTPSGWKLSAGLRGKDKGASRDLATRLWPGDAERFRRVKDDGRAEACLIARHGLRESGLAWPA